MALKGQNKNKNLVLDDTIGGNGKGTAYKQGESQLLDIPDYYSPTAGARYSYGGGSAPGFNYSSSGRPTYNYSADPLGAFSYDVAKPGDFSYDVAKPGDFEYGEARPEYASKYDDQINQMVDQILNREKFAYDYNVDPLYQMYAESYGRSGGQAMEDTLAQVSARTGGLASSYAGTAAQQAYNRYMQELNDKIPQLYQIAYDMYRNEGNDMRSNLGMMQDLDTRDYSRYQDLLGQWNTDRNLAYDQWQTRLNQWNADRNLAYDQWQTGLNQWNTDRDVAWRQYLNDQDQWNANRDFAWKQYQNDLDLYETDRNWAYKNYQNQLDQYNRDRNYDYQVWQDNLARTEAAAQANYAKQVANIQAQNDKKASSTVKQVNIGSGNKALEFNGTQYDPKSNYDMQNLVDNINSSALSDSKKKALAKSLNTYGVPVEID